jgi:V-type H+-transporting ATPase subunit a
MFGDVGHAIVLVCFGGYLVIAEKKFMGKKSSSEIFNIFFAGRYIILLMGIFSMYTGFVYNDIFSKSMNIFGTRWSVNMNKSQALENELVDLNPSFDYAGTPYFIGVDPVWQVQLFLFARLRLMLCFSSLRTRSYF